MLQYRFSTRYLAYERDWKAAIQIMKHKKPIELDGRTGEGGGQLVRISVALAAVTSQPIRITHIRGNRSGRSGGRGGGKSRERNRFSGHHF